jgi:peptidoglycan-associated lipoprotein
MVLTHLGALFSNSGKIRGLTCRQIARKLIMNAKNTIIKGVRTMNRTSTAIILGLGLVALTACTPKVRPEDMPRAPMGSDGVTGGNGQYLPGSREDFRANTVSDRVYFETSRSDIDPEDRTVLDSQVAWLQRYPNIRAVIEGHCDERGTRDFNLALGARRANAAKNYLAAAGINPARLSTVTYGKERPEATGSDAASWARNRRAVTVTVQ